MYYVRNMYNVQLKELEMKDFKNKKALEYVDQESDNYLEYFQRINNDLNGKISHVLSDKYNLKTCAGLNDEELEEHVDNSLKENNETEACKTYMRFKDITR